MRIFRNYGDLRINLIILFTGEKINYKKVNSLMMNLLPLLILYLSDTCLWGHFSCAPPLTNPSIRTHEEFTKTTTSPTMIALGLEGSANKLGVGVISHPPNGKPALVLSNIRHTFVRSLYARPSKKVMNTDRASRYLLQGKVSYQRIRLNIIGLGL